MERAEIKQAPEQAQEKSFQNILDFLAKANCPINYKHYVPHVVGEYWERNLRITGQYAGTTKPHDEIAREHDLTRQRVRHIFRRTIFNLHKSSNRELRSRYPLRSFNYRKPISEIKEEENARLVVYKLLKGQTIPQIKQELGATNTKKAIHRLREQKIKIPRKQTPQEKYAQLNYPDLPPEEVQKIFDGLTRYEFEKLYKSENPLLVSVTKHIWSLGYYLSLRKTSLFTQKLIQANIAVGNMTIHEKKSKSGKILKKTYYFIRSVDQEKVKEVFENNPEFFRFKTNPVKVLGAPSEKIPTTTELFYSGNYLSFMKLVKEVRGKRIGVNNKYSLADLIGDSCPVSIFCYSHNPNFLYHKNDKEILAEYLTNRLVELDLL